MKNKVVAALMAAVMVFSITSPVMATDGDTVSEVIDETLSSEEDSSEESSEDASEDTTEEVTSVLALGADLTSDQKETVLGLMGLSEDDASSITTITVTNDEEHEYLDDYLESSVIGTKSLSSVYVVKSEDGAGLDIEIHNINYCTVSMYANALITAGLEDASVIVAAPFEISGTAALIGTVKAYAEMNDTSVDEEALETATEELVVTGEIGDAIGDADDAATLMAQIKQYMVENNLHDEESIEAAVREKAEEYGYDLTDEEVDKIVDVLLKIDQLDLDLSALTEQASAIFDKLTSTGDVVSGIGEAITTFFTNVANFFKGIFG
ncbi:MAG: DUF1002 domain-containing protein [Eubacterium sp.]|nr:DUF1002 domain-containing protein [Eubacterium sp.]